MANPSWAVLEAGKRGDFPYARVVGKDGRPAFVYGPKVEELGLAPLETPAPTPVPVASGPAPAPEPMAAQAPAPAGAQPMQPPMAPQQPDFVVQQKPSSYTPAHWQADQQSIKGKSAVPREYVDAYEQAAVDRTKAEQGVLAAEASVSPEVAGIRAAQADAYQQFRESNIVKAQRQRQEEIESEAQKVRLLSDQYASAPPPSEKEFWNGLGAGGSFALILGQALSTFGAAINGQTAPQMIDRAIERSIALQNSALAKKRNSIADGKGLIAELRRQDYSQREAEAIAEASYRKQLDMQVQAKLNSVRDPVYRAKLEEIAASNREKTAKLLLDTETAIAGKVSSSQKFVPGHSSGGGTEVMVNIGGRMVPLKAAKDLKKLGIGFGEGQTPIPKNKEEAVAMMVSGAFGPGPEGAELAQKYIKAFETGDTAVSTRQQVAQQQELQALVADFKEAYKKDLSYGLTDRDRLLREAAPIAYEGSQKAYAAASALLGSEDRGPQGIRDVNLAKAGRFMSIINRALTGLGMNEGERASYFAQTGLIVGPDGKSIDGVNEAVFKAELDRIQKSGADYLNTIKGRYQETPVSIPKKGAE